MRLSPKAARASSPFAVFGHAAQAAYYNTYTDIASTPNTSCCTGAQGFAAGTTYLYSIKNHTNYDDVSGWV
jgi:hypothetical protein